MFQRWKHRILEDRYEDGLGGPPNNWAHLPTFDVDRSEKDGKTWAYGYNARFSNDAHEIWIGSREIDNGKTYNHWRFHCTAKAFRRIALWYLWRWAWGEWFGLRRELYFADLRKRVAQYQNRRNNQ